VAPAVVVVLSAAGSFSSSQTGGPGVFPGPLFVFFQEAGATTKDLGSWDAVSVFVLTLHEPVWELWNAVGFVARFVGAFVRMLSGIVDSDPPGSGRAGTWLQEPRCPAR
jgi:hypothetical protein